jgi:hypothetical protein
MNCLESQAILQRRLDGAAFVPDAELDQHLTTCAVCRDRHAAARPLLEALRVQSPPVPPQGLPARIVAAALRDRQRRRLRLRRSLTVTVGLAAAIVLMLFAGYLNRPGPEDGKVDQGPFVQQPQPSAKKQDSPQPQSEKPQDAPPTSLIALSERLADKTLDEAKVLWTAANPVEGMPMGELPAVPDLDPATQPLRQAKQEVNEGLQAVGRSAQRAFAYFSHELPMMELPQGR